MISGAEGKVNREGLFSTRGQLTVNGRDRSKLLDSDSVARQVEAVRTAIRTLHHAGVTATDMPMVSVPCLVDTVLPMFGTPRIGGAQAFSGRLLLYRRGRSRSQRRARRAGPAL